MCMQCISVQNDQPTQRLLLKANSCNVHCEKMLMTENGTEKLDNELITTLFENITTLAQLHQFTRAEGKTTKDRPHIQKVGRDPFFPFLPSFVGFRMLMDPSKAQHRI